MGFKGKLGTATASILLCASLAGAQSDDRGRVKVMVLDSVGLSPTILHRTETEATRIFAEANVQVQWINCLKKSESEDCHHSLRTDEFMLHIVHHGKTKTDLVFGEAFLGEDGTGKYADVFFDRIEAACTPPELDTSQLLAAVAAHEVGHLLLGSRAHSSSGIMQPVWEKECLRKVWMGSLLFTRQQAQSMQQRFGAAPGALMAVRGAHRKDSESGY